MPEQTAFKENEDIWINEETGQNSTGHASPIKKSPSLHINEYDPLGYILINYTQDPLQFAPFISIRTTLWCEEKSYKIYGWKAFFHHE